VLFFLYLGYLALRRIPAAPDARAAKRCAIAALIAFVDVPIVHFLGELVAARCTSRARCSTIGSTPRSTA